VTLVLKEKKVKWEREVQEEQEEWLVHLELKERGGGLAEMGKEVCLAHLDPKESPDFKACQD